MPLPPVVSTSISLTTPPRIQVAKHVRNGLIPNATFETELANAVNFTGAVRNKEMFRWHTPIAALPDSKGGSRVRWRFAAHTGPLAEYLRVIFLAAPQNDGDPISNPKCTLYITDATESTTYSFAEFNFGASNPPVATPNDYPSEFGFADKLLSGVPANTTVYGRFEDSDAGRLISACVCERSLAPTDANGYVIPSGVAATTPIYDARRSSLYTLGRNLWKRGAGHLLNWTVDDQSLPRTNATATVKNIIDNVTVGSGDARWRLDLSYCGTRARSSVAPCKFAVYAKMSGATEAGVVTLGSTNSGNIVSINVTGTTAQWYTTTVDLETAVDDYYVSYFNSDGTPSETLSVYACSLFQYSA